MSLILDAEQTMLRDSARDFIGEQSPVSALRRLRDSADADGFSRPLWQRFAEMGFTGVLVPEALGGLGLGHVEAGVVMGEVGRQLCASPLLASGIVAVTALRHGATPEQQQRWLPRLASGELIATLAVDESPKHRPERFATRARRDGAGWRIDGNKQMVLDGHVAGLLIVAAGIDGIDGTASTVGLFAVDPATPGVTVERTVMVDAHNAARVRFDGVMTGAGSPIGAAAAPAGNAARALRAALDAGRTAAAAELLGLADAAFERTVQYLKDRRQFGKAIGEFQALQHRAAHLYCELELGRAALAAAQRALDADIAAAPTREAVAVAKSRCGRAATLAVQEAVQMHGGMGMTDGFEIGFFMKRARVLHELFGDAGFHLDALAMQRGY